MSYVHYDGNNAARFFAAEAVTRCIHSCSRGTRDTRKYRVISTHAQTHLSGVDTSIPQQEAPTWKGPTRSARVLLFVPGTEGENKKE